MWRGGVEAELVAQIEGEASQRPRLGSDGGHPRFADELDACLGGDETEHAGRSHEQAFDPWRRLVVGSHGELVAVAEPALDGVGDPTCSVVRT